MKQASFIFFSGWSKSVPGFNVWEASSFTQASGERRSGHLTHHLQLAALHLLWQRSSRDHAAYLGLLPLRRLQSESSVLRQNKLLINNHSTDWSCLPHNRQTLSSGLLPLHEAFSVHVGHATIFCTFSWPSIFPISCFVSFSLSFTFLSSLLNASKP